MELFSGYNRSTTEKTALLLREGCVGVIPTDTIYGVVGSALSRKTVEMIYRLRKRNPQKPFIVLIDSLATLKKFGVTINDTNRRILKSVWPGKVSVILPVKKRSLAYLHRGTRTLAFRLPAKKSLEKLLRLCGPLVAPSANPEGLPPALTIAQARRYFGNKVDFYIDAGKQSSLPSTLIRIVNGHVRVERRGAITRFRLRGSRA